ncbi:MAG: site-2 protease family protein [archaeon]
MVFVVSRKNFFAENETTGLFISWVTITLAFALVLSEKFLNFGSFLSVLPVAAIGVGTGFVLHELAHKYVAIHYGAKAEFRYWNLGLILAIVLPLITFGNFLFAAPGAVYIYGKEISRKQNGIISLAGPAANIILALAFLAFAFSGFFPKVFFNVAFINIFLAAFNLLPVFPLDGSKVFAWNPAIWGIFFVPLAIVVLFVF